MDRSRGKQFETESLKVKLEQLPVLPSVVARLLALSRSSDRLFDEVIQLAGEDPPFAARVIRAANSADSAPASSIETIRDAVARLGGRRIAELAMSMAVVRVFVPTTPGQRELWCHSLEVAVGARKICETKGTSGLDPEIVYLGGLLHDIGRFVLFDDSPDQIGAIDESGWDTPADLVQAEREICGLDHAELGWHMCRVWAIPQNIAELIRDHHVYVRDCTSDSVGQGVRMVGIIQLADCLSMLMRGDQKTECEDEQQLIELIREQCVNLGWNSPPLQPEELAACVPFIREESQRLISDLGLGGSEPPD